MTHKKQFKDLDFNGQVFNIGIDTHKRSWRVTIRSNQMELKNFSMNPSPKELTNYMRKNYPGGKYYSVYEAGFCGYWIHRELTDLDFINIIVNPADVPTTNKEKTNKADPIDSRKLARELENGSLKGIFIPNKQQQALRSLSRLRFQIVKKRVQIKNRIKGFLHFHGIEIPENSELSHWSGAFIVWLKLIEFSEPLDRMYLDTQIAELKYQRERTLKILRTIRKICNENKILRYIKSIPGIGLITAFTIYAELIDIRRFKNLDHQASFVGLIPLVNSSGDKEIIKGITFRHNKHLRYLLVEAAWQAIRKDPVMTMRYNQLIKRMSKQRAIIHIAKKLLNRIRYVWLNEKEYVIGVVQ